MLLRHIAFLTLLLAALPAAAGPAEDEAAIRAELASSVERWNAGDIEGFMDGYVRGEGLRFASGNTVRRGWRATLERYIATYGEDRASMGALAFEDLEIELLADGIAQVFGRFRLARAEGESEGLFTLLFRRIDGRWLIVSDHTSSAS